MLSHSASVAPVLGFNKVETPRPQNWQGLRATQQGRVARNKEKRTNSNDYIVCPTPQ